MDDLKFRHELKHRINRLDCTELRARLKHIARYDENAGADGCYTVKSLYFDDYEDSAVREKLSGVSRREKFRLRYYSGDSRLIRLERKIKINSLVAKESAEITAGQCAALLCGEYEFLKHGGNELFLKLYAKLRFGLLRPKSIVDYTREAYVFRPGNVRITLDSNIRTSSLTSGFLDDALLTMPAAGAIILEVKYDNFMPDVIADALQIKSRQVTEFSKYTISRFIKGENNYA